MIDAQTFAWGMLIVALMFCAGWAAYAYRDFLRFIWAEAVRYWDEE